MLFVIRNKDVFDKTMIYACNNNNIKLVKRLLEKYNYPQTNNIVNIACYNGNLEILELFYLHNYEFTKTAMDIAVIHGHINIVEWLYQYVKIGFTDETITLANNFKNKKIVEYLNDCKMQEALLLLSFSQKQ